MTRQEFRNFVEQKCMHILELLDKKGSEYAISNNAFHNFEEGCKLATSENPECYAWDLRSKHLQSIKDMISNPEIALNKDQRDEKCSDDILYGFIIWAMTEKYFK